MIPTLRILTRKSKLNFSKWGDYTVQQLLDLGKRKVLISPYYKLTSINYTEDILIELGISSEYRIKKPSKDLDMYYKFLGDKNLFKKHNRGLGADIMKKESRPLSRAYLQSKNQGH